MGTFNERAEKLMSTLTDVADNLSEASMLKLVNFVTLDVIVKVLWYFTAYVTNAPAYDKSSPKL